MFPKLNIRRSYYGESRRTRYGLSPRVLSIGVWAMLVAWVAWIALEWTHDALPTAFPPPSAQPRPVLDLESAIAQAASVPLFGAPAQPDSEAAKRTALNVKLRGVFASQDGPAAAIVNTGGEDQFVPLGRELGPGVVLAGVYPTHVMISRAGLAERVDLDTLESSTSRTAARASKGGTRARGEPAQPTPAPSPTPMPGAEPATGMPPVEGPGSSPQPEPAVAPPAEPPQATPG